MSLTACATIKDRQRPIDYPSSLFVCLPEADISKVQTDNDLAVYIADQHAVVQDCKGKLSSVERLLKETPKK